MRHMVQMTYVCPVAAFSVFRHKEEHLFTISWRFLLSTSPENEQNFALELCSDQLFFMRTHHPPWALWQLPLSLFSFFLDRFSVFFFRKQVFVGESNADRSNFHTQNFLQQSLKSLKQAY